MAQAPRPRRAAAGAPGSAPSGRRAGPAPCRPRPRARVLRPPAPAASVGFVPWSCRLPCARAELDVVDVLRDRRMLAADRAVRIATELDLVELGRQRVEEQQPADERLADPERELERASCRERV